MIVSQELFFDTIVDTKNIIVTIRTSFLLHNYTNSCGEKQILMRISCNGTERIPLGLYINPELWDKKNMCAYEQNQELKDLNLLLQRELSKINDLQIFYRLSDIRPSLERIVSDYKRALETHTVNKISKLPC